MSAFLLSIFFTPLVIEKLKQRQFGQRVREDGVKEHLKKTGIPTMGGIIILLSICINIILWCQLNIPVLFSLFALLSMGTLGFIDDFTKITRDRSLGLTSRQKIIWQILFALIFVTAFTFLPQLNKSSFSFGMTGFKIPLSQTVLGIPYFQMLDIGYFFIPFAMIVLIGSTNAVNLTDGLDGLASGVIITSTLPYIGIAYVVGNIKYSKHLKIIYVPGMGECCILLAIVVGAVLGFLWFNAYPAEIFMGDTGSLSLGALIGSISILTRQELLLVVIGGIFVVEALSVIIQVLSFKLRNGKRVFRMAPIHHHFELLGWAEPKVVFRFWIIAMMLSLGGLALLGSNLLVFH
ncbi:phospho-N-acetylmuramoyl-pentapeptide-transferase [Candidatus Riflebacteria bacterium]